MPKQKNRNNHYRVDILFHNRIISYADVLAENKDEAQKLIQSKMKFDANRIYDKKDEK
jgi:hypothetical protein